MSCGEAVWNLCIFVLRCDHRRGRRLPLAEYSHGGQVQAVIGVVKASDHNTERRPKLRVVVVVYDALDDLEE